MNKEKELNENGVVVGDSGGDPVNIASGELSGNITSAGGGVGTKTKLKKKAKKKILERVLRKE